MTMEKKTASDKKKGRNFPYIFQLYITGASPNSSRAITNFKNLCESCLRGKYELNIIDVYQQPHIAKGVDIIALPLLVRKLPLPERRLIGDLSDQEKVIKNLGILNLEQ
jgi:circadian clock protein KaiB